MTPARHLDNDVFTIWKFLLREGGYWTAREIREHWEPIYTGRQVRNILDRAVANKLVREKTRPRAHTVYGVTACCKAPPGYEWMLDMAVNAVEPINWPVVEANERSAGPPQASSAPLGGSAVREATSVGAFPA